MAGWICHGEQGGGCVLREVEQSSCEVYCFYDVQTDLMSEV